MKNFVLTSLHAGEKIPKEAFWLKDLCQNTLLTDVDRFVSELYEGCVVGAFWVHNPYHRYAVDMNRKKEDVDKGSVLTSSNSKGERSRGLYWQHTTKGETLMSKPLTQTQHEEILSLIYEPCHKQIQKALQEAKSLSPDGQVYHMDLHSMPSKASRYHRDEPGEFRPEVIVSDLKGTSCMERFSKTVIEAYKAHGFEVKSNEIYFGGGVTQIYGKPHKGQHTLQVELRRDLYMDEKTFEKKENFENLKLRLKEVIKDIFYAMT